MTEPLCGAPHHRYPDTLCTEPAGHYQPDRDPHAGPLIINGREAGAAAWDEPKETPMPDQSSAGPARSGSTERCTCGHTKRDHSGRRDHRERYGPRVAGRPWCHACETECIYCPPDPDEQEETEAAPAGDRIPLDNLTSDQLDNLYAEHDRLTAELADYDQRVTQLEAAHARVHHVADLIDAGAPWTANHQDTAHRLREALGEQHPAATEATGHVYLSTGCLHGEHDYCQAMTGHAGAKRPGQCKFCSALCTCPCHQSTTDQPTEA